MEQASVQTSAQRKLARGIEHVETLRREAGAFQDGDAYTFRVERETRAAHEVDYRCFAIGRKAVPDHWALLAGEAAQNLRSALDHAVFAATSQPSDEIQFPISRSAAGFTSRRSKNMVKGITESVRAAIERAQPYNRLPQNPDLDRLWQLRFLSNLDKHKALAVVVSAVDREIVGIREGVDLTWSEYATGKPLGHGETHISTFTATSETEINEVDVSPDFAYEVAIQGQPISHLVAVAQRVFEVVTEIESDGTPISPFAQYPIMPS